MNTKIQTKQLHIGQAINQNITLPIVTVGEGSPCIGITCGIHGNEPEGMFIVKELLAALPEFVGSIKILPGANPFGLILNQRVGAFDFVDLNRAFPGDPSGTLTERVAAAIFDEFKTCDVVFDIHTVTNMGAFMGMELNTKNEEFMAKTRNFNRLLRPDAIWVAVEGNKYSSALDEALMTREGVVGIGVEVPRLDQINEAMMQRIVDGFIRVIQRPETVEPLAKPISILANAKRYFSDGGGLYTPVMPLLSLVSKGDVIGVVTDLTTMVDTPLTSMFDGILFVQSTRKVLKTGDKVYVVTEKIGEFV